MTVELKIKAKHLAAEARIIREEANKLKARAAKARLKQKADVAERLSNKAWNIQHHNKMVVRAEARATHLARAFIKGTPYRVVEQTTVEPLETSTIDRIVAMAKRYGDWKTEKKDVLTWVNTEA